MGRFSRSGWIAIVGVFLTAILSVLGHVLVREWYQPDLRYEMGEFYRSSDSWITALRLENYGREPAEEVVVVVNFPVGINEYSVGSMALDVAERWDGPGSRSLRLQIPRVAPGQSAYIYFDVPPFLDPESAETSNYVTSIVSSGGLAEEGAPEANWLQGLLIATAAGTMSGLLIAIPLIWFFRSKIERIKFDVDELNASYEQLANDSARIAFGLELMDELIALAERRIESGEEPDSELLAILSRFGAEAQRLPDEEA